MSRKDDTDSAGRKQPSKCVRRKRAINAAKQRWKEKYQLEPGSTKSWSERSHGNKVRHLAAARKGGETTGHQIREQQRLFWRWYHGDCKALLSGPFKTVVETFERIEAEYDQRYGSKGLKGMAWDGFFADMFRSRVLVACGSAKPEEIEREMWARYQQFMDADDQTLVTSGLLQALFDYDDARDEKKTRLMLWRQKQAEHKQEE